VNKNLDNSFDSVDRSDKVTPSQLITRGLLLCPDSHPGRLPQVALESHTNIFTSFFSK